MSGKRQLVPRLRFPEFQDAEEWTAAMLGSFAIISKGKGLAKSDLDPAGKTPCVRYGELYTKYRERISTTVSFTNVPTAELVLSKGGEVLLPSSGETAEDIATAACVTKSGIAIGGDINIIRSKHNGMFLSYYLNGVKRSEIGKMAQGISVIHLYGSQLQNFRIEFPGNLEQQKIADCLSSLDALITAQEEKLEALKAHKKGLMQQLFPREGETVPRLRFPEFREAGEWEEKSLEEMGEIITGKTPSTKNKNLWGGDVLFITPTDISEDQKYQRSTARKVVKKKDVKVLPKGSIVYTCIASIGKMAMTTCESATNQQINSIIVHSDVSNEFMYYMLLNITPWVKSIPSSSTLPIINKSEFSNMTINIPTEIDEQQEIADCLSSLDALIASQKEKLEALKAHKQGLMQKLFPHPEALDA